MQIPLGSDFNAFLGPSYGYCLSFDFITAL